MSGEVKEIMTVRFMEYLIYDTMSVKPLFCQWRAGVPEIAFHWNFRSMSSVEGDGL